MQKKILLKKTREYLQASFPENLLPARKIRQSKKKLFFRRSRNLKGQVIKAKKQIFNQYCHSARKLFILKNFYNPVFAGTNQSATTWEYSSNFLSKNSKLSPKNVINDRQPFLNSGLKNSYKNKFSIQNSSNPPFLFSTNQISYELSRKKKRSSDFKDQLKERKKLALVYGKLSQKYIKKTLKQASKLNGKIYDNFFFLLEARLDVILFRACFFSSIKSARQWINHNKILVNNTLINTCSYRLNPGDIISIKPKYRILLYKKITQFLKKTFSKQVKKIHKQFIISTFLFQKLKSFLRPLSDTRSAAWARSYEKKNKPGLIQKNISTPTVFSWPLAEIKTGSTTTKNMFLQKKVRENSQKAPTAWDIGSTENYKDFFFQVKQVLRSLVNKYSKNKKHNSPSLAFGTQSKFEKAFGFKNANSFTLNLNQAEKNTLLFNLIELEYLEKKNVPFLFSFLYPSSNPCRNRQGNGNGEGMRNSASRCFSPIKGKKETLQGLRGFLVHLKLKKFFFRNEKKKQSFTLLNQNALRPINLEISYKNLLIIYLYPPQKITFPCSINMEYIYKSLT